MTAQGTMQIHDQIIAPLAQGVQRLPETLLWVKEQHAIHTRVSAQQVLIGHSREKIDLGCWAVFTQEAQYGRSQQDIAKRTQAYHQDTCQALHVHYVFMLVHRPASVCRPAKSDR